MGFASWRASCTSSHDRRGALSRRPCKWESSGTDACGAIPQLFSLVGLCQQSRRPTAANDCQLPLLETPRGVFAAVSTRASFANGLREAFARQSQLAHAFARRFQLASPARVLYSFAPLSCAVQCLARLSEAIARHHRTSFAARPLCPHMGVAQILGEAGGEAGKK